MPSRTLPACPFPQMVDAARAGELKALYVVGANPSDDLGIAPCYFEEYFRRSSGHVPHRNCSAGGRRAPGG